MALERFGCTFKPNEVNALFASFDKDHSGFLDYNELSAYFAKMGAACDKTYFNESREPPHSILEKLKKSLKSRGV